MLICLSLVCWALCWLLALGYCWHPIKVGQFQPPTLWLAQWLVLPLLAFLCKQLIGVSLAILRPVGLYPLWLPALFPMSYFKAYKNLSYKKMTQLSILAM